MRKTGNIFAVAQSSWKNQNVSARLLRIFLGITWVYAGWDKATDPGFLTKGSSTFIGTQLASYAQNSPISAILNHTIEHAQFVGAFVMVSEFAIGFATLLWITPTLTAFSGFAMSTGLWLSSSFHVKPYFFAADTAYAILWLVYLTTLIGNGSGTSSRKLVNMSAVNVERRSVIRIGAVAALASATSLLGKAFPKASAATTSSSAASSTGKKIVKLASLPVGGTHNFTTKAQGVPAVLFRTKKGVFAFSAICTHQGCTVSYNSGAKKLQCPCHGAQFDPFNGAKAVAGPTNTPLSKINVAVSGAWIVEA